MLCCRSIKPACDETEVMMLPSFHRLLLFIIIIIIIIIYLFVVFFKTWPITSKRRFTEVK